MSDQTPTEGHAKLEIEDFAVALAANPQSTMLARVPLKCQARQTASAAEEFGEG